MSHIGGSGDGSAGGDDLGRKASKPSASSMSESPALFPGTGVRSADLGDVAASESSLHDGALLLGERGHAASGDTARGVTRCARGVCTLEGLGRGCPAASRTWVWGCALMRETAWGIRFLFRLAALARHPTGAGVSRRVDRAQPQPSCICHPRQQWARRLLQWYM
jgi:hypothetical protein